MLALLVCGCGVSASPGPHQGSLRIVAAENLWGSIAAQLGGARANVQSIIVNPAQDPHSYEPTPADARKLALAQLAIVNGAVNALAGAITARLTRLDPRDGRYFAQRHAQFERVGLERYRALIARIKARYTGLPVGASESIFAPLAPALGLRLITPQRFMNATSEGTDVTVRRGELVAVLGPTEPARRR